MPAIDVDGVGSFAFPLQPLLVERLIDTANAAPHGRGQDTVIDRDVRRTWQIEPGRVQIAGRHWQAALGDLVAEAALGLGVSEPVAADFYKLLVYDAGSFFVDHRDTEKGPGMFATLTIVLPSVHDGGNLVVRHLGREVELDLHPEEPSQIGFAAFYADCVHEVRPVVSGYRVALVYNLRFLDGGGPQSPPDYRAEQERVAELLRGWSDDPDEPVKLILPLEHAYTPAELSFDRLKGADAAVAMVVAGAAEDADCDIHLALVSIEESGSAEHTDYYDRRRRWSDHEEYGQEDQFEAVEVFEQTLLLSHWRRPDGGDVGFGEFPFDEDELSPPDAFEDLTPDEQHFYEATGNEGATFDRTYRRAGLVLWPRARRLAVLNQAGLVTTLPHLEGLTDRWQASGAGVDSPVWCEADALSELMLHSWPRRYWSDDEDTPTGRMLDLLVRLKNPPRIDGILAELCAQGCYSARDNAAIVRAAACLPTPRATDLLARIVSHNARFQLPACGALLLRCVEAESGFAATAAPIGAALIEALPGDPATAVEMSHWQRPKPVTAGFVVDLLTALSKIDVGDAGLAVRAIAHLLAWPHTYEADDVLVPAAIVFAERPESSAWPAVRQLREACLEHLRRRIAEPLHAPKDWVRANSVTCDCADCRALGRFLADPGERQWRLRAAEHRRGHVEQVIREGRCDLDLATESRGRPYTLIATKNQASYERRANQRRQDLAQEAALDA